MNYAAHLNTSHVSPSLSPITHGLLSQRRLCKKKKKREKRTRALNESSKYVSLNLIE